MKKLFLLLIIYGAFSTNILLCASPSQNEASEALTFVKQLPEKIHTIIKENKGRVYEKEQFKSFFKNFFDVPYIAQFCLGRHLRKLDNKQKNKFLKYFSEDLVYSYSTPERIELFNSSDIKFSSKILESERHELRLFATAKVANMNEPVNLEIIAYKQKDEWKVRDLKISGISQIIALRSEYNTIFNQGKGAEDFLNYLKKRVSNF